LGCAQSRSKRKLIVEKFLLGKVMLFSLLNGTIKEREQFYESAQGTKNVSVLCHWYIFYEIKRINGKRRSDLSFSSSFLSLP
jgi:hypothetical protein